MLRRVNLALILSAAAAVACGGSPESKYPLLEAAHADPTKLAAARAVYAAASQACPMADSGKELALRCTESVPVEKRLEFAQAVANADAVILIDLRPITFYGPDGKVFARADPMKGIRLASE